MAQVSIDGGGQRCCLNLLLHTGQPTSTRWPRVSTEPRWRNPALNTPARALLPQNSGEARLQLLMLTSRIKATAQSEMMKWAPLANFSSHKSSRFWFHAFHWLRLIEWFVKKVGILNSTEMCFLHRQDLRPQAQLAFSPGTKASPLHHASPAAA